MPARLLCKTGRLAGMECLIEREATIGSHPSNTISLPRGTVSRRHARIYYDARDNCYYLEDLRSRNGTLLDGSEVRRAQKLGPLHVITFVEHDFVFVNVPKTEKSVPKPARNVIEQEERPASGKPIFPKKWPLEKLERLKIKLGSYDYSCNIENNPTSPTNRIFKPPVPYWDVLPQEVCHIITVDPAISKKTESALARKQPRSMRPSAQESVTSGAHTM